MRWLALVDWVVVLLLLLPVGGTMLPSLGTLVLVCVAGLGTMIAFGAGASDVFAWISVGMACLALVLATVGGRTLIYDTAQTLQGVRDSVKGVAALVLGVGLPILVTVVPISIGAAVS
jgi:hypothetical protein